MSYSFDGRIRYSETGENGLLTLPGILNYFQDCSIFHSEEVGRGVTALEEKGRLWVLSAWQVVVNRYPGFGERIVTSTWPYDFRGFMGMRNFVMETKEGERLAWANTFWTYMDAEKGCPVKLTEWDVSAYSQEKKLEMDYEPRKIPVPEERKAGDSFQIQKHHLDTNHHVNNCQYIQMAMEYLPEGFRIRQMRAEYKQQARLHHTICPETAVNDGKYVIVLNDQSEKPYSVVEFTPFEAG